MSPKRLARIVSISFDCLKKESVHVRTVRKGFQQARRLSEVRLQAANAKTGELAFMMWLIMPYRH
jgi:hypothetical protein